MLLSLSLYKKYAIWGSRLTKPYAKGDNNESEIICYEAFTFIICQPKTSCQMVMLMVGAMAVDIQYIAQANFYSD